MGLQLPKDIPFPASINSLPIVPKKLSQAELDSIEAELEGLNINVSSTAEKRWKTLP